MSMLGLQSGRSNLIDMADKMLQVKNGIQHTKKQPERLNTYLIGISFTIGKKASY